MFQINNPSMCERPHKAKRPTCTGQMGLQLVLPCPGSSYFGCVILTISDQQSMQVPLRITRRPQPFSQ